MNNLQIFNSPDFGQIRTIQQNGEPWFVGKELTMLSVIMWMMKIS